MNQADILYRAFLEYRKQTLEDGKCKKLRAAISGAQPEGDRLEAIRSHCIIEEDWVNRIYEGLPFIEKAIREERQFITQQGEVVPIEKAKRISKGSVEHLARHSDMITHEPEPGADIVPDELYVVERLSDFAVYENRFLYMLLCYLRDFIDLRYSKIIELGNTYRATLTLDKEVKIGKRVIRIKLDLNDEAKDDPFGFVQGETDGLLKRIEEERHIIAALLLTPLMKIVSKSPMLKPPVTRTNALRMNNNFKNALALYDYIAAYSGDGFRIENIKKTFGPFPETMGDEFAEITALASFLAYEYGKELKPELRHSYEREEERRRLEAEERHLLLLKELKKRVQESGEGMDEYLLQLENRNISLEADRVKLGEAREQISALEGSVLEYRRRQHELLGEIDGLRDENARQLESFEREKREMNEGFAQEKQKINDECSQKLTEQRSSYEEEKRQLNERHSSAVSNIRSEYDGKLASQREGLELQLGQSRSECERVSAERDGLINQRDALLSERTELRAELHAHRQMNGTISEEGDFSDKARFSELERELAAIKKLRDREWRKAKKGIRRRILWGKGTDEEPAEDEESAVSADNSPEADNVPEAENAGQVNSGLAVNGEPAEENAPEAEEGAEAPDVSESPEDGQSGDGNTVNVEPSLEVEADGEAEENGGNGAESIEPSLGEYADLNGNAFSENGESADDAEDGDGESAADGDINENGEGVDGNGE